METKLLLGSSDSEDDDISLYPYTQIPKKTSYAIEFKQLLKIVRNGNLDEIIKTLKEENLQLSDADRRTVLHVAAVTNNKEVLSLLLDDNRCSALLNHQDKEDVTPLLAAMMTGSYATLELLCAQGADPCKPINNRKNVLHLAAKGNDIQAAEIVLKYNSSPELINALNANGDTPLIESVYVNSQVYDLLLTAGADITVVNPENGRTILHVVVTYNRDSMLNKILQHPQATVDFADIKDMKDNTALLIAVKLDKLDMVTLLLNRFHNLTGMNNFDCETVFHIAIRHDRVDILKVLLNSGCNSCVNVVDVNYRTPILYAAELDNVSCLEELIENGADYNLWNLHTGETFIHVIARSFSHSCLSYVMDITDIAWFFTQVDFQGSTPYMTAISRGNANFLREALKMKQVDLCDVNSEGEPPVYFTAKNGHLKTMMTLLLSPKYYSFIKDKENDNEFIDSEEIMNAEIRGHLCATDVYLLLGKVIKYPLVPWFPPGLLLRTRENKNVFHACAFGGNLEGLRFLYEFFTLFEPKYLEEMFDKADLLGNTPLLFAAQCGVMSISCVHFFVTRGADLASVNKAGVNVFHAIFTCTPEVAESLITSLLDTCVTGKREHYYDKQIDIKLNFNMLCPKDTHQMMVVYKLFEEMSRHDNLKARRKVLQHPVIELFLKYKYHVIRGYLVFRFLILLIATVVVSFLMPIVYVGDGDEKYIFMTPLVQKTIIAILFTLSLVPAFFKLPNLFKKRIWPTDAAAFIPLIIMMTLICFGRTFLLSPELTAVMILSIWIFVMLFLTTLYSTYSFQMAVFFQILNSISKHLLVLTICMFAFTLSFFCLYHKYRYFSSFPTTFIYTFTVLLLGFSEDMPIFEKDYFTSTPITFHFLVECLILGAFTLIIVIGFINMLIGLAVRSANVAELDGKIYQHYHQAHFLYMLEFWFNNKLYNLLLEKGILPEKIKKLRDKVQINLEIRLYDDTLKGIVNNSTVRQFRSIIFRQHKSKAQFTYESEGSFEDSFFSWFRRKSDTPSAKSLIAKQAQSEADELSYESE